MAMVRGIEGSNPSQSRPFMFHVKQYLPSVIPILGSQKFFYFPLSDFYIILQITREDFMKEFEGIGLKEEKPFSTFGLIFWVDDTPSQNINFDLEIECDKMLQDIIAGKGIDVDYCGGHKWIIREKSRIFPNRVIKVIFQKEYSIPFVRFAKVTNIGNNENQPIKI